MRIVHILLLCFLLLSPVLGQDYVKDPADESSVTALEVKDWIRQAEGDAPKAQYWLGKAYVYGWHVERDLGKAVSLFQASADRGSLQGMNALGYCYQRGLGVEQDYEKALPLLRRAADGGEPNAVNSLAEGLYNGWGVKADPQAAYSLFRKAAQMGSVDAFYNVGRCYLAGRGVEKSVAEATKWFVQAAERGHLESLLLMGERYVFSKDADPVVKQKGLDYYEQAAASGSTEAMVSLGKAFSRDEKRREATRWFKKAATAGDPDGMFFYGGALYYGEGVRMDKERAKRWITQAAELGQPDAQVFFEIENRPQETVRTGPGSRPIIINNEDE